MEQNGKPYLRARRPVEGITLDSRATDGPKTTRLKGQTLNENSQETLVTLTTDIVAAHVSNNSVAISDLPNLIQSVYAALSGVQASPEPEPAKQEPAVSIRTSVKPDYIICLEDGKKLKMLKRHLMTHYQMTPDDYRAKWNLAADYPMVAPNYAEQRRTLAKKIGLGRKTGRKKLTLKS